MKNNKGFVFIETIITIVVVSTTLILLYATYSKAVSEEKKRLYYDDIAYIFKTQTIKNSLDGNIDFDKFAENYDKADYYGYFFHIESDVYTDSTLIEDTYDLFNFETLYYLKFDDIQNVKNCINNSDDSPECEETIKYIQGYGKYNLEKYLKTIDASDNDNANGILIALFYEMKNGDKIAIDSSNLNYKECINQKVYNKYSDLSQEDALEKYRKDTTVNFNMSCEKAYYIAWVYGFEFSDSVSSGYGESDLGGGVEEILNDVG